MKLLYATGNEKKCELMRKRVEGIDSLQVIIPKQINIKINVEEDGKTAEENAIKKAKAYHEATKFATIAEDSGLWIEEFSNEDQPGLLVKRVNGREELSDEELLKWYIEKLNKIGGRSRARYITAIALISKNGEVFSKTVEEEMFILTTDINNKEYTPGAFLDVISYDPISNKYFNELTEEDKLRRYDIIDKETRNMIKEILK